jgi:hypothetical protein
MLLQPYRKIKERLQGIASIKLIDWFNDQYGGVIHTEPCLFIEFLNAIEMDTLSGKTQEGEMTVRVHSVSKVLAYKDNRINETAIESHELINKAVYGLLQGYRASNGEALIFNSMMRRRYEHHHYMQGWMVTTQDFDCIVYDLESVSKLENVPEADVVMW